jgi:RNA polymerase sigma-70 factor (ECF subfamily)
MGKPAEDAGDALAAARAGNREAMGQALEYCRRYLITVADGQLDADLRSKGGASDLVQETFLEAQRDFGRFQGSSPEELRAWLRQVLLHNVGAFTRRYRTAEMRAVGREVSLQADGSSFGQDEGLAESALSPSGVAIEHEQTLALHRAVERLPQEYRRVVLLRFEDERTFEEIGRLTGQSERAARHLWTRAMVRLRQEMDGQS